ncbi:MAG: PSD1 domain-containing protein [Candidatus Solibacter usitatus]|nr:PSD1 domain-containing protein [Candidatus Solibacter usitatus]
MTRFRTAGALLAGILAIPGARGEVSFNRDIRPIMSDTCFRCHGPDKNARMAGLRLDLRDEALKPAASRAVPIVPGDPERSAVVQRVLANDARVMPPKYAHKELTPAQKELIRRWVAEGARYEGHWAYAPVKRPAVPAGARYPIDAFVQARLARDGLAPAPEADQRTLLRRLALDLTGLPPTSAEVEAFAKDRSPEAYEKVVDRLLASPRYAEKQTMHWLDAVRYADTCGFHGDNPFPAWPYRDFVLRSFRDNKPFDQFTREQLAGDLLPDATVEQKIASAYNRLNRTSAEGGVQPKEYLAKYAADRVRTTSTVWLGSTMGCAECHDHKFDPFAARDFYSMKAFFADIQETGLVPDNGPKAWGTQLALPSEAQRERMEQIRRQLAATRLKLDERATGLAARRAEWEREILRRYDSGELAWRYQRPVSAESANGATLTIYNDELVESSSPGVPPRPGEGLIVASGPNPDNETYTVTLKPGAGVWTALGVEVVQDEGLAGVRVARGADRLVLTEVEAGVPFAMATSNLGNRSPELPAMAAMDGDPKTGWGVATYGENRNLFLALRFARPLRTEADSRLVVRLRHDSDYRRATIGRFRLALSPGEHSWPEASRGGKASGGLPEAVLAALRAPEEKRSETQQKAVLGHFQWAAAEMQPLALEVAKLEAEMGLLDAAIPRVVVAESGDPAQTRILPRGNWMDDSGEIVEPAIPAFLGKLDTGGRRATRLDLANWLVSPANPLTARVFANRLWRQFFGTGLSKTLDDLGSQGEWPVHAELLDWLAAEFRESWDIKRLVRTIVLSRTYRQSSRTTPQLAERDPDNRLLARQSRFRADAEIVRDIALAVSGLLVEKFGGPSARPYQPDGYLAALNFPKREYSASRLEDLYRRGLYTLWQRTFLHPSLATFDAPTREECTANRTNSNTPLQALVLLNDPTYVEAARVFAQKILQEGGRGLEDRVTWAFLRALSRKPTPQERRTLAVLYRKSLARFQAAPADAKEFLQAGEAPLLREAKPAELAALTAVARAILNLHETITRN